MAMDDNNNGNNTVSKLLLGKLVAPKSNVDGPTLDLFKNNNNIGIIIVADWVPEDRILYLEILVGEKRIIKRSYPSVSVFRKFWKELRE